MVFNLLNRQKQQAGEKTLNCAVLCLIVTHVFPGHAFLLGEHKYERTVKDNKEDRNNRSDNEEPITFKHDDLWIPDRKPLEESPTISYPGYNDFIWKNIKQDLDQKMSVSLPTRKRWMVKRSVDMSSTKDNNTEIFYFPTASSCNSTLQFQFLQKNIT